MDKTIFECKKYVTNSIFIKKALALKLSLEEFLMLTYFDNDYNSFLNIEDVSKNLGLSLDEAYKIFNNLISRKLIIIESTKDLEVSSLKKKFKDKKFAAGCSRDVIKTGAELLNWELDELFEKTILAMRACEDSVNKEMESYNS